MAFGPVFFKGSMGRLPLPMHIHVPLSLTHLLTDSFPRVTTRVRPKVRRHDWLFQVS